MRLKTSFTRKPSREIGIPKIRINNTPRLDIKKPRKLKIKTKF